MIFIRGLFFTWQLVFLKRCTARHDYSACFTYLSFCKKRLPKSVELLLLYRRFACPSHRHLLNNCCELIGITTPLEPLQPISKTSGFGVSKWKEYIPQYLISLPAPYGAKQISLPRASRTQLSDRVPNKAGALNMHCSS
jgi:hypothetical protein